MNKLSLIIALSLINFCNVSAFIDVSSTKTDIASYSIIEQIDSLNSLSVSNLENEPFESLKFANEALSLSIKNEYTRGNAEANFNLGEAYYETNQYENALNHFMLADSLFKLLNDEKSESKSLLNIGVVYDILSQYNNALKFYKAANKKAINIGDNQLTAESFLKIGSTYRIQGFYDIALENSLTALSIFEQINDNEGIQKAFIQLGIFYRVSNELGKAKKYFEKTFQQAEQNNDLKSEGIVLGYLGLIELDQQNFDEALDYFQQSLDIRIKIKDKEGIAISYNNLGKVYLNLEQYEKSRDYFIKALLVRNETGNLYGRSESTKNIGLTYLAAGYPEKSINYFSASMELASEENIRELIKEDHLQLSIAHQSLGDYKNDLIHFKNYYSIQDSINASRNNQLFANLKVGYETYRKEKEIELLQAQNRLDSNWRIFLIVLSLLLILLGIVFYSKLVFKSRAENEILHQKEEVETLNQKLSEQNKTLNELNNTKDKFFSIIAHDLKNPFTVLLGFSDLLESNFHQMSEDEKLDYIKEINITSKKSFSLLENLLNWARTQTGAIQIKKQRINLYKVVDDIVLLFSESAEVKNINIEKDIPEDFDCYADKFMLTAVIRNLISNAIKFSQNNGTVKISLEKNNDDLKIKISDNGIGISAEDQKKLFNIEFEHSTLGTKNEKGTGLGLILSKEFVEKNGGELSFVSEPQNGTTFSFTVPNYKNVEH